MTAPPPPPKPTPARRWIDRLTGILLLVAAGGTVRAAAPALMNAAGLGIASREGPEEPVMPMPRPTADMVIRNPHRPLPDPGEEEEQEPRVTELERLYPDAPWPGRHRRPKADDDDTVQMDMATTRIGMAKQPLELRQSPESDAATIGKLDKGQSAVVLKERGDWVFLMRGADKAGWAKKSEIAIR